MKILLLTEINSWGATWFFIKLTHSLHQVWLFKTWIKWTHNSIVAWVRKQKRSLSVLLVNHCNVSANKDDVHENTSTYGRPWPWILEWGICNCDFLYHRAPWTHSLFPIHCKPSSLQHIVLRLGPNLSGDTKKLCGIIRWSILCSYFIQIVIKTEVKFSFITPRLLQHVLGPQGMVDIRLRRNGEDSHSHEPNPSACSVTWFWWWLSSRWLKTLAFESRELCYISSVHMSRFILIPHPSSSCCVWTTVNIPTGHQNWFIEWEAPAELERKR